MSVSPDSPSDGNRLDRRLRVGLAAVAALLLVAVLIWSTGRSDVVAAPTTTLAPITTSSSVEPSTTTTGSSSTSTTVAATTTTIEQRALAELVPGITGTLHALVGGSNRELMDLPADPEAMFLRPDSRLLGFAGGLSFDVANALLAFTTLTEGTDDTYRLEVWSDAATFQFDDADVTEYRWHASQAGQMAVIAVADGRAELRTITFETRNLVAPATTTITEVDSDHSLIAWGDYGFILTDYDPLLEVDVTTLVDQTGTVLWQADNMTVLDASSRYLLTLKRLPDQGGYEHSVVDPNDPDASISLDLPLDGTPTGTAWSPSERLAVHYPTGGHNWNLRVYDVDLSAYTDVAVEGWRVWDLEWGPNDRFLLMPGTNDAGRHVVIFYDTTTEETSTVDFHTWVQWADLSE